MGGANMPECLLWPLSDVHPGSTSSGLLTLPSTGPASALVSPRRLAPLAMTLLCRG